MIPHISQTRMKIIVALVLVAFACGEFLSECNAEQLLLSLLYLFSSLLYLFSISSLVSVTDGHTDGKVQKAVGVTDEMAATARQLILNVSCFCQSDCDTMVKVMTERHGGTWRCAAAKGALYRSMNPTDGWIWTTSRNWDFELFYWK